MFKKKRKGKKKHHKGSANTQKKSTYIAFKGDILDDLKGWTAVDLEEVKSPAILEFHSALNKAKNRLVIQPDALSSLMAYCAEAGREECAGYFIVKDFTIAYIDMAGIGSFGDVTLSAEKYAESTARLFQDSDGMLPTGQWHTHPNSSSYWSSKDQRDQQKTIRRILAGDKNQGVIWFLVFTDAISATIRYVVWGDGEILHSDINLAIQGKEIVNISNESFTYHSYTIGATGAGGKETATKSFFSGQEEIKDLHKRRIIFLGDRVLVYSPHKEGEKIWCDILDVMDKGDERTYAIMDKDGNQYEAKIGHLLKIDMTIDSTFSEKAEKNIADKVTAKDVVEFTPQDGISDIHGRVLYTVFKVNKAGVTERHFQIETEAEEMVMIPGSEIIKIVYGEFAWT